MLEEIDKRILELYTIYKEKNSDIDKLFIDIHELICSYKTPIISYQTYNIEELKSYIKYKKAWEELKEHTNTFFYQENFGDENIYYNDIYIGCITNNKIEELEKKHGIGVE